ncbi:cupin domain-containing protein [Lyngbya confervoides]|uniref:dTDP-4-dehydrorhamnose 3,5-epimerase n=1 Tax=Lyngbya confervoides BDU141951 TaxID=1574623 RepID=A0ABD4T872_9CYAN|nr:cupin domain-containing protein [Lyngbya confervoides]MCM1984507.1 dTDP-4-dehydrorhamnose 3,5-epimerase [Lyngbya confervoides BDU141951]
MGLSRQIQIKSLESTSSGMAQFYTPQSSNETMLVKVDAGTADDLFVHHFQTDQLLVVSGQLVLVVLQNRQYQYIPLNQDSPQVVTIPPGVPHGAVNLSSDPCLVVNAVIRHGTPHERDYRPLKTPFPYDMQKIRTIMEQPLEQVAGG